MERKFGPYTLIHQIAVGGMAEIYLARTEGIAGFEKYVAIKMIHPNFSEDEQFVQMLIDEAKITVQLTHVNLNDMTTEGIRLLDVPAFCVQYHPEAAPGPHDARYLFGAFTRLMDGDEQYMDVPAAERSGDVA